MWYSEKASVFISVRMHSNVEKIIIACRVRYILYFLRFVCVPTLSRCRFVSMLFFFFIDHVFFTPTSCCVTAKQQCNIQSQIQDGFMVANIFGWHQPRLKSHMVNCKKAATTSRNIRRITQETNSIQQPKEVTRKQIYKPEN